MCYKPLYRSRKVRQSSSIPTQQQQHQAQTNYNYIVNHNNIAASSPSFPSTNPMLFNPMATSMMMFMMQQHFLSTMMSAGLPQMPVPPATITTPSSTTPRKANVDRITRFWL
jgi:hypothetical protein